MRTRSEPWYFALFFYAGVAACTPAAPQAAPESVAPATTSAAASAPTPSRDPCASTTCPTGQHCTAPDDRPRCVAN